MSNSTFVYFVLERTVLELSSSTFKTVGDLLDSSSLQAPGLLSPVCNVFLCSNFTLICEVIRISIKLVGNHFSEVSIFHYNATRHLLVS